jgi:hypothetical protein
MDILKQYVEENLVCKKNILKLVDDYSIYSFYIKAELELQTKYSSPLRKGDDDPSFSIYYSKYKKAKDMIMFKDSATGKYGNVFDFVRELMTNGKPITMKSVLLQINSDFGLGLDGAEVGEFKPHLIKSRPLKKHPAQIEITSYKVPTQAFQDYWNLLDISEATLEKYQVKDVKIIHYISEVRKTIAPRELTISYEILGTYKLYQPFADKKNKFRNNYETRFIEGAMQLDFKRNFCIITKSTQECIFFYEHFSWECVAGKSENTMLGPRFMNNILKKKYKQVFIWLDPDEAGVKAQDKYIEMYPWLIPIKFHDYIVEKDPTDLYRAGKRDGKEMMVLQYLKKLIFKHFTPIN